MAHVSERQVTGVVHPAKTSNSGDGQADSVLFEPRFEAPGVSVPASPVFPPSFGAVISFFAGVFSGPLVAVFPDASISIAPRKTAPSSRVTLGAAILPFTLAV